MKEEGDLDAYIDSVVKTAGETQKGVDAKDQRL